MENTLQIGLWKCLKKLCLENITFGQYVVFSVDVRVSVDGISSFKFSVEDKILKENLQNKEDCIMRKNLPISFQNEKNEEIAVVEGVTSTERNKNCVAENVNNNISSEQIQADGVAQVSSFDKLLVEAGIQTDVVMQDVSMQTDFEDQITAVQKSRRKSTSTKRKKKVLTESIQLKELSVSIEPLTIKQEVEDNFDAHIFSDNDSETDSVTILPELPPETQSLQNKVEKEEITCPLCPSVFRSKGKAENHLRVEHDIGNVYICDVCQDICQSNNALQLHLAEQHGVLQEDVQPKRGRKNRPRTVKKIKIHVLPIKKPTKVKKSNSKKQKTKSKSKPKSFCKSSKTSTAKIKEKGEVPSGEEKDVCKKATKKELDALSCFECDKCFSCKRALIRHNRTVHALVKHQFQCDACGKCFTSKETLYHHKRGIHGENKPYKCDQCDASFNFNHSLRLHRLKHSGQRPHKCTQCDKSYLTSNHLKMHMEGVHQSKKNHMCRFCPKSFSYRTSLQVHELTHGDTRPYKCSTCGHGFINSHSLKYHFESKHALSTWFFCDICGKKYKTEFLMKTHRRRHTADGSRYMCDICGRQFMYKSTLEIHAAVHSEEKTFVCSICGKSFKTYATLYSHQYVHKTDSPYKCSDCGKPFKTKERCKAHQRRHSGLKPFECDLCGRCFPDKGGLSKHKKTVHCDVKKFVCPYCGKSCSRADNLRVHMKIHGKGTGKADPAIDKQIADAMNIQKTQEQRHFEPSQHNPLPVTENLQMSTQMSTTTPSMSPPTMMGRPAIGIEHSSPYVLNPDNNSLNGINMSIPLTSHTATAEISSPIPPTNMQPVLAPSTTTPVPSMAGISPYPGMYMWPYTHSSTQSQHPHDGNTYY